MASKFYDDDDDDVLTPKDPQVNSNDPEERKAARSLRIKRRQEALRKAEQPPEEIAAEEQPSLIEQATANAAEELQRLQLEVTANVTNVKVTTDEREVFRRAVCAEKKKESIAKVEQQVLEAQLQYDAVTSNWDAMIKIRDPLDIDDAMKEQRRQCDDLLRQKDELIAHLKNDLLTMDLGYYTDLEKQDKDIKELSDRIEKQLTVMQRAYEMQLGLIEVAVNTERAALVDHNNKRWESLYKLRDKEELMHIDLKEKQLQEHKKEMEVIMWDHHEKYRDAKIELETLVQELQKELEKLKATCLINTEKIGYNYQILKKREEENVFVRSQQKRKLNKMSDMANTLRNKIRKAAEDGALEEMKADAEIVKLMQAMDQLEKKSYQFARVNDYKFGQIWRMCVSKCYDLMRSLRRAEVAMHAHILAEPPPPKPPPPPKSPMIKRDPQGVETQVGFPDDDPKNVDYTPAKDRLVQHILQLVADNTGFLIEERLIKLIEKYQPSSRNLCTLDAIFMALEIQADEDIELLCKTFINYAFCPTCVGLEDAMTSDVAEAVDDRESSVAKGRVSSLRTRASTVARTISCSTSRSAAFRGVDLSPEDKEIVAEAEDIIQKYGNPQAGMAVEAGAGAVAEREVTSVRRGRGVHVAQVTADDQHQTNPYLCAAGHNLEIEQMQVLSALGEFISVFVPPEKKKLYDILDSVKPPDFSTPSRTLKTEDIEVYWTQWKNIFSVEKDRFWDGLLTGLRKYLNLLRERQTLHEEVVHLRARNAALRRMIRGELPKLPQAQLPKYARPNRGAFAAAAEDLNPPYPRLPQI